MSRKKSFSPDQPFHGLLAGGAPGRLRYLKAEDHYVRVVTSNGEDMLRMRFRDAIARAGEMAGVRVHRSYWVADEALGSVRQDGKRFLMQLRDGTELPVSKSGLKALRNTGLNSVEGLVERNLERIQKMLSARGGKGAAIVITLAILLGLAGDGKLEGIMPSHHDGMTANVLARDAYNQGRAAAALDSREGFRIAAEHYERAVRLDPDFALARADLALVYYLGARRGWYGDIGISHAKAMRSAHNQNAMALRALTHEATAAEVLMKTYNGRHAEALEVAQKAVRARPDDLMVRFSLASVLIFSGREDEAIAELEIAMERDPNYPATALWLMGVAYFTGADYQTAARYLERALARSADLNPVPLVAAYGFLGQQEKMAQIRPHLRRMLRPGFPLNARTLTSEWSYENAGHQQRLIAGLHFAGLP